MNEITPYQNNDIQVASNDNDFIHHFQEFNAKLNVAPLEKEVKRNKFANNSKYLPISFVEMTLDEIFLGLWSVKNFRTQTIANEIIGIIDLEYFHPVAKTWITRTGAAAVQIQLKSKTNGGTGDITEIRDKITNTLTKDFPHLLAACLTNAARHIGKTFGRDLNREFEDHYKPYYPENVCESDEIIFLEWAGQLENCINMDELKKVYSEIYNSDYYKENKKFASSIDSIKDKRKQELSR